MTNTHVFTTHKTHKKEIHTRNKYPTYKQIHFSFKNKLSKHNVDRISVGIQDPIQQF